MSRSCRLIRAGASVDGLWRREGDQLVISPSVGPPLSIALGEVRGIGGDGFNILLHTPAGDLRLERLGADGPTLLQELRRDWPPLRAGLLRLTGGEPAGKVFTGSVQGPQGTGAFRGFLLGDRFLYVTEGADVTALLLADYQSVTFDAASFTVRCNGWDDRSSTVFSKLGGETRAFMESLRVAREQLTIDADGTIARHLPSLPPAARAALAARWLPGCMLSMAELEVLAPGFEAAFLASWLAHCQRSQQGLALMKGVPPTDRYLGYARAGRTLAPGAVAEDQSQLLWLLVSGAPHWSLELLSQGDYATYLFSAGPELPGLVAGLIRFPEFSREALYMPLTDLVEQRATYAIPARDLPLLHDLRSRFAGRRIHGARGAEPQVQGDGSIVPS